MLFVIIYCALYDFTPLRLKSLGHFHPSTPQVTKPPLRMVTFLTHFGYLLSHIGYLLTVLVTLPLLG
ncbi:MAG: hypothetical protein KatS3mg072_2808 [Meiothermus sp.]|nr:MAG: hypothetical protein KatS3mg072_2808 [Meiothermus sp.]